MLPKNSCDARIHLFFFIDIYYRILHILSVIMKYFICFILKLSKVLRNIILYTMR